MEKMFRKIFLSIFISISLLASSAYLDKIHFYDKQMGLADDSAMLKIFHSLQNIYIKSIIQNDQILKKETLKRLVKCSKILKIDGKNYEKELHTLLKRYPEPKKRVKKTKSKEKKSVNNSGLRLISILSYSNKLELKFNHEVTSENIKSFALKGRSYYRKIYDIKAVLTTRQKTYRPKNLKKVRVAQFDKNTVRVVLETKYRKKYYLKIEQNRLTINFSKPTGKPINKPAKTTVNNKFQNRYFTPGIKTIVLDPGHGGKDSGAIGYQRRYEKRAVLQIALKCAKELKKRGYKVYLTRSKDYFVKLRDRTKFANRKKADLFISIHANAAPRKSKYLSSKGLETFFLSPDRSNRSKHIAALENRSDMTDMDYYSKNIFLSVLNRAKIVQANKMALDVQQGILKSLRSRYSVVDGGVREAPFWVLVGAQMPAILIETGYITNPTEALRLFNFQYQKLLAKGIADGVDNYFLKN